MSVSAYFRKVTCAVSSQGLQQVISGTVLTISVDIDVRSIVEGLKIHSFSEIAYHFT